MEYSIFVMNEYSHLPLVISMSYQCINDKLACSLLRFLDIFENSFFEMNPSWFLSRAWKARWALLVTSISETTLSLFLSRLANISDFRQ